MLEKTPKPCSSTSRNVNEEVDSGIVVPHDQGDQLQVRHLGSDYSGAVAQGGLVESNQGQVAMKDGLRIRWPKRPDTVCDEHSSNDDTARRWKPVGAT
jgi:hypothetical protein